MFQIMSATFDEGGASGLLLNHLRCYDDGQLLVLDSGTVVPVVEEKTGQLGQSQSQSRTDSLSVADVRGKGMRFSISHQSCILKRLNVCLFIILMCVSKSKILTKKKSLQ